MELVAKTTALEIISNENISATLTYKAEMLKAKNLPVENGLADYIALGVQNIDNKVAEYKNYKRMIDDEIKQLNEHKDNISKESAKWMQEQGMDKLNGAIVSSVTITKGKEAETKVNEKVVFSMNGIQYTDLETLTNELVGNGIGVFEVLKTESQIEATEDKIRINKKKK